jgi:hypothetical protein
MEPELFNKKQGYCIDGDRNKKTTRKTPEETISTSSVMATIFPTRFPLFVTIISFEYVRNKYS